jgi:hypothetical protein
MTSFGGSGKHRTGAMPGFTSEYGVKMLVEIAAYRADESQEA